MKKSLVILFLFIQTVSAQTFNKVYNLLQTNCTGSCHNNNNKQGQLDLTGSLSTVYAAIVNVNPTNPAAGSHKDKLVSPGDPHHSFLLRKCNNGLDADNGIVQAEGNLMPSNGNPLAAKDIELIRQWILNGASQTTDVVDTAIINKFYSGKGIVGIKNPPPLPTVPGSFQIHLGKIFLPPSSESEYFIKTNLNLADTVEVNKLDLKMATQSHHFIIYKFLPGAASAFADGLRLQDPITGANSSNGNNTLVNAWQTPLAMQLPANTAYMWEKQTVLDLNYHLYNTNTDSVLAVDLYFDVYTQPKTTPVNVMHSELIMDQNIYIPNDSKDHTFISSYNIPNAPNMWNVWLLSSHTHKYGKNFDIYKRNADGSEGDLVFDGLYDTQYKFKQGYYDWEHPPIELISPMMPINPRNGLIQKAVYNNTGSAPVQFGLTTKDEMMLYFIQYTIGSAITGINETSVKSKISIYPNPFSNYINVNGVSDKMSNLKIELLDALGKTVLQPINTKVNGVYNFEIDIPADIPKGLYTCKIILDEEIIVKKTLK